MGGLGPSAGAPVRSSGAGPQASHQLNPALLQCGGASCTCTLCTVDNPALRSVKFKLTFCAGNHVLRVLTSERRQRLRIDMSNVKGDKEFAEYDNFLVGEEDESFRLLSLGKYSGNAGKSYIAVLYAYKTTILILFLFYIFILTYYNCLIIQHSSAGCSSAYPVQARSDCSSVSAGQCSSVPCGLLQVYD